MIKILNGKNNNFLKSLSIFLDKRRSSKEVETKVVNQIVKDIKKNKIKALLKYEKKFLSWLCVESSSSYGSEVV